MGKQLKTLVQIFSNIVKIVSTKVLLTAFVFVVGGFGFIIVQSYNIPVEIIIDKFAEFADIRKFDHKTMTDLEIDSTLDQIWEIVKESDNTLGKVEEDPKSIPGNTPGNPYKRDHTSFFLIISVVIVTGVLIYFL